MEDSQKKNRLEKTVISLLEAQSQYNIGQINMLLMLSLVNLMGIVDVLQRTTGGEGLEVEISSSQGEPSKKEGAASNTDELMQMVQQAASGSINPAQLLGMLNRQGGHNFNHAALLNLLSQMLPPPPPPGEKYHGAKAAPQERPQQKSSPLPETRDRAKNDTEKKQPEDTEKKPLAQKPVLKWDPRLG
ncbi:MAG: hypothetical protein H0Z40_08475 [Desulfotomaculum sp.]|nr:hypothetical protein [Desulfotomaculum sp.]